MKRLLKRTASVFFAVCVGDVLIGLVLMPFDYGGAIWPILHIPIFTVFPFDYLIVGKYKEALYLWPTHAGLLAALVYFLFVGVKLLTYNKALKNDADKPGTF